MNPSNGRGTPRQPLILITNDDGIDSPGLHALVNAAHGLGEILVAAPTTQQTAQGRSLGGDRSASFRPASQREWPADVRAFHIAATPALTVRHALAVLTPDRLPDLVLSGINYGENVGSNITISGTVGAAFQAAAQGLPAVALSRQTTIDHHYIYGELDWSDAERVSRGWIERMLALLGTPPAEGQGMVPALPFDVLKIDIPDPCPPGTEERITRLSRSAYFHSVVTDPEPDQPLSAAITSIFTDAAGLDPHDDIHAVAIDRVVSVTPLTLDCTAPLDPVRNALDRVAVRSNLQ